MYNIEYLRHKKLIKKLNSFSGTIVLFGYSDTTRDNLKKIKSKNILIIDNNENLYGKIDKNNIVIDSPNILNSLTDYLVVVWGNYCKNNIKQLKKLNIKSILVDLDNGGYRAIPYKFIIETPPLSVKKGTKLGAQHKFILNFIKELTLLQIPYETKPIDDIDIDKKYILKKDEIYISYHTKGKNIRNLYRYKESYLPDYVTFDDNGFSGWHSLTNKDITKELENIDIQKANKFYEKIYKKYVLGNKSKYQQKESQVKLPKKYVFLPLQVATDVVAVLSEVSQEEILNKLIDLYKDSDTKIVVKKHPKCTDIELDEFLSKLVKEKKIVLFSGSVHQAIKDAKVIYTINSGVGFEALLHLKDVVVFGLSEYNHVTTRVKDLDIFQLNKIDYVSKEIKKKFLFYYLSKVATRSDDRERIKRVIYNILLGNING